MEFSDITAVVVNWVQAQRTLGAVRSVRKFYPDLKMLVVDDGSGVQDKPQYMVNYKLPPKHDICFDPDIEKLKIPGIELLALPYYSHLPQGNEGKAMEVAMNHVKTPWIFHFHSDFIMLEPGLLEEMMKQVTDDVCAVGDFKTRHDDFPSLDGIAELLRIDIPFPGERIFEPALLQDDGSVIRFRPYSKENGFLLGTGAYYTGTLCQHGYRVMGCDWRQFGIHLPRPDKKEFKKYYA